MNCTTKFVSVQSMRNIWRRVKKNYGEYSLVQPGNVSNSRTIPNFIKAPPYYESGVPMECPTEVEIKVGPQIGRMRQSCELAAFILNEVGKEIKVGMTTDEIDNLVHNLTIENNAYPSPLNYQNFPKSTCTSVNNVACHGIPDDRMLQDGDIVNVDITVFYNGYHGDCSKTFLVGNVDEKGVKLVKATEECVEGAISICQPGQRFSNIGLYIEQKARKLGFNIIPCFVGHGIGSYFHGPPDIYHFKNSYPGYMAPGMTFTIEPVLTPGSQEIIILDDGWTAITSDNARTAQFEHTILITEKGCEVLTKLKV